jgi:hypothetical protein
MRVEMRGTLFPSSIIEIPDRDNPVFRAKSIWDQPTFFLSKRICLGSNICMGTSQLLQLQYIGIYCRDVKKKFQ